MSTNGVILQHGAELVTYLLVDRSDNLFIGNYIKSLSLTTGDCNWENTATCLGVSPVILPPKAQLVRLPEWADGAGGAPPQFSDRVRRARSHSNHALATEILAKVSVPPD
jgi:hypothetical protein